MAAIALIKTSQGIIAMTNSGTEVKGFESVQEGIQYFEEGYRSKHSQGYEASMSACINNVFFQPRILDIQEGTLEALKRVLGEGPYRAFAMSSVAGRMTGILLPDDKLDHWDRAVEVKLI